MKALSHSSATRADVAWPEPPRCCAATDERGAGQESGTPAGRGTARKLARGKAWKLLRHADFQRVYKQGRRHFAAHMTVFYLRREEVTREQPGPRVGLTVGRALGGAVERNRIKRRLREAVRRNLAVLAPAVDVVINPKKSVLRVEFTVLDSEIAGAFQVIAGKEPRLNRSGRSE